MQLSYGEQQVFLRRARHVGLLLPKLLHLMVFYAAVVTFYAVFRLPLAGFTIGLMTGFVIMGMCMVLVTRTYAETMGVWAEDWSCEALDKAGWRCVRNLNFQGFDVDAVAATPTKLLAIETKWRMGARTAEAEMQRHGADLSQAVKAAGKVRSVLRCVPDPLAVPVVAVLILWGTVSEKVTYGWDSEAEVYVLDGNQPWDWPEFRVTGDVGDPLVNEAFAKAEGFAKSHSLTFTHRRLAVMLAREVWHGWKVRDRKPRRHGRPSAA